MIYDLGSLGADYLLTQMMALFRELRAERPDALFLFLINNGRELVEAEAAAHGIPLDALRFTSAERRDVPEYLAMASLSAVFIRPTLSKAGCSPTKLGELFALQHANAGLYIMRQDKCKTFAVGPTWPPGRRPAGRLPDWPDIT